jgi:hypothetical protein
MSLAASVSIPNPHRGSAMYASTIASSRESQSNSVRAGWKAALKMARSMGLSRSSAGSS